MKTQVISIIRGTQMILCVLVILFPMSILHSTTHVIQFGGALGIVYSPNTLNVSVGDTVQWEGDFTMHPLSSTTIPAGATSFQNGTGNTFSYAVIIAGTYNYQCDVHHSSGMIGSFTATTITSVENKQSSLEPNAYQLKQNYPNPFNPTTTISFDLPIQSFVSLKVYNLIGQEVAAIVNEDMAAGSYSMTWNAASMPSGIYLYRLQTKSFTETRKLVLLK
jgi:plastocyanin